MKKSTLTPSQSSSSWTKNAVFSSSLSLTDTSHPLTIHPFYLYPYFSKQVQLRLLTMCITIEVRRWRWEIVLTYIIISYAQKDTTQYQQRYTNTKRYTLILSTTKGNREGLPNSPSPSRSHARDDLERPLPLSTGQAASTSASSTALSSFLKVTMILDYTTRGTLCSNIPSWQNNNVTTKTYKNLDAADGVSSF